MASFDLPRPLLDYFAFAETTPTREGRRFSITLPYLRSDGRIDRLQWWYHLAEAKQKILGEEAVRAVRAEAIERFSRHIERWLCNTAQTLRADGPIPQVLQSGTNSIEVTAAPAESGIGPVSQEPASTVVDSPASTAFG